VLGTVGAFVPLVVLVVVAGLTGPGGPDAAPDLLPTQTAVVTASLGTLAWLLSRGARWPVAVAVWTGALAGVVAVAGARLYLGWSTASGTATSVLLGAAWVTVFVVAWATRDHAVGDAPPSNADEPATADGPPRPRASRRPSRVHQGPHDPC
jgi:undecaprenyl-diphosphatase